MELDRLELDEKYEESVRRAVITKVLPFLSNPAASPSIFCHEDWSEHSGELRRRGRGKGYYRRQCTWGVLNMLPKNFELSPSSSIDDEGS